MPRVFETPESIPDRFIGIIYSESGCGKTQLVTSIPCGEKEMFFATFDNGSDPLLSVRPENKKKIITWLPDYGPNPAAYNAYREGVENLFAVNWKAKYPQLKWFVVDGFSEWSDSLLRQVSNGGVLAGQGGDKHLSYGNKGEAGFIQQPTVGDYGFAQQMMYQSLDVMLRCQSQLNIIVVCNEGWWKPESGSHDVMIGGPDTIGGKSIHKLTRKFDNVFRIVLQDSQSMEGGKIITKRSRKVITEKRGVWAGKLRHGTGANPLPEFELDVDTTPFWKKLAEVTK